MGMVENQQDDEKKKKKKTMWDRFLEGLQWIAIILGWQRFSMQDIANARPGTQTGTVQVGDKQMSFWVLKIAARFSKEDEERETVLAQDTDSARDWQKKYFNFRDYLEENGWDTTELRLMLIRISRNKDTAAKNIVIQIVYADGNLDEQMSIAKDNHLLEELGFLISVGMWFFDHKIIANLLALPILLLLIINMLCTVFLGLAIVYFFFYGIFLIFS
jgi:hypothetical protein